MAANHAPKWQQTYPSQAPITEKQVIVKVRKQSWITKGEKVLYSFIGLCFIITSMFVVSFSSSTDTLNRNVQKLERSVQIQQVENEGLLFEMKELSRPERITKIAKENGLTIQDAKIKQVSSLN